METSEGVVAVTVDFQTKMATVIFDNDVTSTDEVAQASTNAGYPATLIQTDSG